MKISFIIPAYNAETTIERAIESILNQTNKNIDFEIVIINDGSTDNTKEVMKKFETNDKIKYFEKENSGVADTRNFGVEKANGEYIIFVDSDDYIEKTLLDDIENYINKNIDLIKWNPIFVSKDGVELNRPGAIYFEETTGENGFNNQFGKDYLLDCLWNYAIKKDIMLKFPSGTYHEDYATMPLVILKAKTMVAIDKYEYYYVQSENSIMRENNTEKTRKKLEDKLKHFDNLIIQSNNMNIEKITKENLEIFATNALIVVVKELDKDNKVWFKNELKTRKLYKYIKIRNAKQLIKKACMYLGLML